MTAIAHAPLELLLPPPALFGLADQLAMQPVVGVVLLLQSRQTRRVPRIDRDTRASLPGRAAVGGDGPHVERRAGAMRSSALPPRARRPTLPP
jgi:hypothetical protein